MLSSRLRLVSVGVIAASMASALLLDEAAAQSAATSEAPGTSATPPASAVTGSEPVSTPAPVLPVGAAAEPPSSSDDALSPSASEATAAPSPQTDEFALEPALGGSSSHKDEVVLKPPKRTRWLLLGAGLATTAAWYGAGYGIGAMWPDAPGRKDLRIPVAGPFMDLAHTGCPSSDSSCSTFELVVRTVLVGVDAIGQVGGIALMLEGALFSPSGIEPPRSSLTRVKSRRDQATSVVAIPWSDGKSGAGIGLVGRF